jgi:hypothetical protein
VGISTTGWDISHVVPLEILFLSPGEALSDIVGGPWASDFWGGSASSPRESRGILQRVTGVWVSTLHLLSHSGWHLRKKKS